HPPVGSPKRTPANLKPSIDTIETPDAFDDFVWISRFHRIGDDRNIARQVIGVNGVVRPPLFQLFQRPAAVREYLLIETLNGTGRRQRSHETRNAVHDQTRLALAFP